MMWKVAGKPNRFIRGTATRNWLAVLSSYVRDTAADLPSCHLAISVRTSALRQAVKAVRAVRAETASRARRVCVIMTSARSVIIRDSNTGYGSQAGILVFTLENA